MSLDETDHANQVSAADKAIFEGTTVYIGFFWSEIDMDVTFQVASMNLAEVVKGGHLCLSNFDIPELDYKSFLLDRISAWDGTDTHITTIPVGKLVMLASVLKSSAAPMVSSAAV